MEREPGGKGNWGKSQPEPQKREGEVKEAPLTTHLWEAGEEGLDGQAGTADLEVVVA